MSAQDEISSEEVKRLFEEMRRRRDHEERKMWEVPPPKRPDYSPLRTPMYAALLQEVDTLRTQVRNLQRANVDLEHKVTQAYNDRSKTRAEVIRLAGEVSRLVKEKAQDAADFEIERDQAFAEGHAAGWRHARAGFWHLLRARLAQALGRLERCPKRSAERTQGMVIALEGLIGEVRVCAGVHASMAIYAMSALNMEHAERIVDPRTRMPFHEGVNGPDDSPNTGTIQTLLVLEERKRKGEI